MFNPIGLVTYSFCTFFHLLPPPPAHTHTHTHARARRQVSHPRSGSRVDKVS